MYRCSVLWAQLPAESRTARTTSAALQWGTTDYLLWQIEYSVRCLTWSLSYDKKHPTPKPEPIKTPAQMVEAREKQKHALELKDEMARELGIEV